MLKVETNQQTLINKKGETLEIYKIEGTEDTFAIGSDKHIEFKAEDVQTIIDALVKVCLPNKGI